MSARPETFCSHTLIELGATKVFIQFYSHADIILIYSLHDSGCDFNPASRQLKKEEE
jgi:hypothetical protein